MCTYAGELPVRKGAFGYLSRGGCFPADGNGEPPGAADERAGTVPQAVAFAAGPAAGLLFAVLLPLLAMLMLLPFTADAAVKALSEGSQACLNCHAAPGMSMTLGDGTTVPVHVDGQRFSSSVHASLGCAGCHADVSIDNHPSATYATKRQLLEHLASACRTCHADAQLMVPGISGIEALAEIRRIAADLPVLLVTAFAYLRQAVAAMKSGADGVISVAANVAPALMRALCVAAPEHDWPAAERLDQRLQPLFDILSFETNPNSCKMGALCNEPHGPRNPAATDSAGPRAPPGGPERPENARPRAAR